MISEVLPMRSSQVDEKLGIVRLEAGTTKNNEARTFHYAAVTKLRETLTRQLASAEQLSREKTRVVRHVFHDANGSALNQRELRKAWIAACTSSGVSRQIATTFDVQPSAISSALVFLSAWL